jgi:hypothetical protein
MKGTLTILSALAMAGAAWGQDLSWLDSLDKAKGTGKPVAYLRILGCLDGKL